MAQFFLEWLRGSVTQGGADAFGETEIKTPVGRANNLAMAIHEVEFEHETLDTVAAADESEIQLTMNSKTETLPISNSDLFAKWKKCLDLVTSGAIVHDVQRTQKFYPPLLYAKSSIYLGFDTVGQAAAKSAYTRIGYTLRYVSATRMVQALVD